MLARVYSLDFKVNVSNWMEVVDAIDVNNQGFKELFHKMELAGVHFYIIVERDNQPVYAGVVTNIQLVDGDVVKVVPVYIPQFLSALKRAWNTVREKASMVWGKIKQAWHWLTNKDEEGVDNNYRDPNANNKDNFSNSLANRGPIDTPIPIIYGTMLVGSLELVRSTTNSLTPNRTQVEDDIFKGIHNASVTVGVNQNYSELYQIGMYRYNTTIRLLWGVYHLDEPELKHLKEEFDTLWTRTEQLKENPVDTGALSDTDPNSPYVILKNDIADFQRRYSEGLVHYIVRHNHEVMTGRKN